MGVKMKMGYVSPAAQQAARKAAQARRASLAQEIDRRASSKLAQLIDAAASKLLNSAESEKVEAAPKERVPPPFGADRPYHSKNFFYHINDENGEWADRVLAVKSGDRVPLRQHGAYWESLKFFKHTLRDFMTLTQATPMTFLITPREERPVVGWANFGYDFACDDPKYLARDLAHIDALLAAKGLQIVPHPNELNIKHGNAEWKDGVLRLTRSDRRYDPSAGLDASEAPPPFESDGPIIIQWVYTEFNYASFVSFRPGDRIAPHLAGYFHRRKEAYEKILHVYKRDSAIKFARQYSGKTFDPDEPRNKEYIDTVTPEREVGRLDFMLYSTGDEDALGDDLCLTARHAEDESYFTASMQKGNPQGLDSLGYGRVPENMTAAQLAHIECRFAALGYAMKFVPYAVDNLPPEIVELMWNRAA